MTPHRVRQLLNSGELEGKRDDRGHWRVSQRAVHALLEERPRRDRGQPGQGDAGGDLELYEGGMSRERALELEQEIRRMQREMGRLEGARELEAVARSSLQEHLDRERQRADEERDRAERLEEELRDARRPWWKRVFGRSE